MIYTIRHLTAYRYGAPVHLARCNLRLTPVDGDGQSVLSTEIEVRPSPASRVVRPDHFTAATVVTIDIPHCDFAVEARSRVSVRRPRPPGQSAPWETVRASALAAGSMAPRSPVHFVYASRRVPIAAALRDYARASFPPGRQMLAAAADLMARVHDDFTFDSRATTASTPLADAFAARRGVCQDFAHIMIAALRGLGCPAAYVSGYLRTTPPPGRPRLRGADASHAWVDVWIGDRWVGLDPTNGVAVGDDHIVLARGRDYADVAPLDGIILASGSQRLRVEVDVVPDDETEA